MKHYIPSWLRPGFVEPAYSPSISASASPSPSPKIPEEIKEE